MHMFRRIAIVQHFARRTFRRFKVHALGNRRNIRRRSQVRNERRSFFVLLDVKVSTRPGFWRCMALISVRVLMHFQVAPRHKFFKRIQINCMCMVSHLCACAHGPSTRPYTQIFAHIQDNCMCMASPLYVFVHGSNLTHLPLVLRFGVAEADLFRFR